MINKKKLKRGMKFYSLGIIFAISLIIIIIFTILFADKINNLQETILITTLLSPYVILYIQQIKKKNESISRLRVIALKLDALIEYLHKYSHRASLVDKINISSFSDIYKKMAESKEFERHFKNVKGLINEIKTNDIQDLVKMKLLIIDPEGLYIHFSDKYLIGIRGIIEKSSGNEISSDKNKVMKIVDEIGDLASLN